MTQNLENLSSEEILTDLSKKVLVQINREKYSIERELQTRYEKQYESRRDTLEQQYQLKEKRLRQELEIEYERRYETEKKEFEQELSETYIQKIGESDEKWHKEINGLKQEFRASLVEKDEHYRNEAQKRTKKQFFEEEKRYESFQSSIKEKYEKVMEEYQQEVDDMIEKRVTEMDNERIKLKQEKASFEVRVYSKYNELLEQKEKDMKVLLTDKENQILAYDHEKNLRLNQRLNEQEKERLEKEKVLHSKYEQQLEEMKTEALKQMKLFSNQLQLEKQEKKALINEMTKLELQMRNAKHQMDMWKLEYHKSTMEKFKKLVFEIELNSKKEMEEFARKQLSDYEHHLLLELKQKDQELKVYEKREADFKSQLIENQRLKKQKEVTYRSSEEGFRKLQKFKVRIVELWEALEVPPENRFKFIWNCHSFNNYTQDTVFYFKNEIQRLSERLPLTETIKRREYVKKQIKEVFKGGRGQIDEVKLNELNRELKRLNDALMTNLPNYENKYNEVFAVDGGKASYLKSMNQENRFFSI